MNSRKRGIENRNILGILSCFLPVLILLITTIQSGLASDPVIVDNGDSTFTASWEFEDLTNYTLDNISASNGEVNLSTHHYFWNQSNAQDFAAGQRTNVVEGDGIVISTDDLTLGYLQNQNFTSSNNWDYTNSAGSKVVASWSSNENGLLESSHPKNITIQVTTPQPGGFNGIDTYLDEDNPFINYGSDTWLSVERGTWEQRALIWFDVSSLADSKVIDAKLELYFYSSEDAVSDIDISAYRIENSWAEMSASWERRFGGTNWNTPGGDYDPTSFDTVSVQKNFYSWISWDITSLVDGWANGTYDNNGALLYGSGGASTWKRFYSSDFSNPTFRPKLSITYYSLNTFNETANISQEFPLLDPGAYKDSSVADFELGELDDVAITPAGGGEIILGSESYYKFDAMDDLISWQEDPNTNKNSGYFQLSTTTFYEGTGSMMLDYDLANVRHVYGVMNTTATYWDWSRYVGLSLWVKSSGQGEVMKLVLEDTYGVSWESSPIPLTSSWANYTVDLADFTGDISAIDTIKIHFTDTTLSTTTYLDNITTTGGSPFLLGGTYTSRVFDGGYETKWKKISWSEDKPANTDIEIRTRTGNSSEPDPSWSTWSSPYTISQGSDITSPEGRYIQYQVDLSTSDTDYTPSLSEVILVKSEYNMTFTHRVDAFENISWANMFVKLNNEIIWEDVVSGTTSASTIAFDIGKYLHVHGSSAIEFGLTVNGNSTNDMNISVVLDDFQIKGPTGFYTSMIYDTGSEVIWGNVTLNADLPPGTGIILSSRSSMDNITWCPWSAPIAFNKDNITNPIGRYIQYRINFTTQTLGITPVFRDINITYTKYAYSGTLTFNNDLVVEKVTDWGILSSLSQLRGQNIRFEYSIDSGINWYQVPSSLNLTSVSTSTNKIRFKVILEAMNTSLTPTLFSMKLTYSINRPPVIIGVVPNQSWDEDTGPWSIDLSSYESDYEDTGEKLRWYITGENTSLYTTNGEFSTDDIINFTPVPDAFGNDQVTLWLEDSFGAKTSQTLWINITPVNDPPVILGVIPSFEKWENDPNWELDLSGYKYDKDSSYPELSWSIINCSGTLFDEVTISQIQEIITFDLAQDAYGTNEITIRLSDSEYTVSQKFWVNVTPINRPPVINGTIQSYDKSEDDPFWILDLTGYEEDREDPYPSAGLTWSIYGVNSSLFTYSISDNNITFNLVSNAFGNDEFTIILTDSVGATDSQNIWINVTPLNDAPIIFGVIPNFEKNEDGPDWNYDLSIYRLDIDNSSDELSWNVTGWDTSLFNYVSLIGDILTFELAQDAFGNDEITISLSDGLLSVSQNIWINITPTNDAPSILGVLPDYDVLEDDLSWTLDLTYNETDIEDPYPSSDLAWSVAGVDSNLLSITISDNNLTFTLKPDAFGNDEITIILTDSGGSTDSYNIWVNVTNDNDAPYIAGMISSFEKNEDAPSWNLNLLAYKHDIDNSSQDLFWIIEGWDTSLFLNVNVAGDIITFEPALNAYGNDLITIRLSDGLLDSSQNIWVNITPVNDAPSISGTLPDYDVLEDDSPWILDLTLNETDVEDSYPSSDLTWSVAGIDPNLLSISISDNNLTFTLNPDAFGDNEITIILTDSGGSTDIYNIWVNVTNVNDAPNIAGIIPSFEKNEDSPSWNLDLSAYKYDIDNPSQDLFWIIEGWDPLLFINVNLNGDIITFEPALNAFGNDMITIRLSDGLLDSSQNIWVNITPVNDAPSISGVLPDYDVLEDDSSWILDLTLNETDIEDSYPSSDLTWSVMGVDSDLISVVISDNNLTFTLKSNAYGNNEITIRLTDSQGLSDSQNIWVNVTPQNDAPQIQGTIPDFDKDEDALDWFFDLSPYKFDSDNLTSELSWSIVGWSTMLFDSVTLASEMITFDLALNAYGSDMITIRLSDGLLDDSQDIWVNVASVNDAPVIIGSIQDFQKKEDSLSWTVDLTSYESDIEDTGPSTFLTWSASNVNTSLISIAISDNNITFTPVQNAFGYDYITIILTDSGGLTYSQMILIEIASVNDVPTIQPAVPNIVLDEDTSISKDLSAYANDVEDPAGQLTWSLINANNSLYSWQVNPATHMLYIDPLPNKYGTDYTTLKLTDSHGASVTQSLQVVIIPVNDPPYIYPEIPQSFFDTLEDEPISVILTGFENDVEDSNALLTWEVEDGDSSIIKVSVDLTADEIVIVPVITFSQDDTESVETQLTLVLSDSGGLSIKQNVTVKIIPVNNAPTIKELPDLMIRYDTPYKFDLAPYLSDEDTEIHLLTITTSEPSEDKGSGYIEVKGLNLTLFYPESRDDDTFSVLITVSDGQLSSYSIIQVSVSDHSPPRLVTPIPDVQFDEDKDIIDVFDLDDYFMGYEEDPLNYSYYLDYSHHGDQYVFVTISKDNFVDFSAAQDWFGREWVTFRAEDTKGAIAEYTITVSVNPVNDAPVISGLGNQECKINVSKILDISPFIEDVDTPIASLLFATDSTYIAAQGSNLIFFYDEVTKEFVNVIVSDGLSQDSITIEVVASPNKPPLISTIPELVVRGGEVYLFSLLPYVSDTDDEIENLQVWTDSDYINVNPNDNMLLQIDFPSNMVGDDILVTIFISDGLDSNSTEVLIHITNELIPKLVNNIPNLFFAEDSIYSEAINLNDYFENAMEYQYFGNENVIISIEDGWVSLSAPDNWSGAETVTFKGLLGDAFAEDTIEIVVKPVNDPPEILPLPSYEKSVNEIWALNLLDYIQDIDTPIDDMIISVDSPHVILYALNIYFQYPFEIYDTITVAVNDGLNTVSAFVYVNVTADNNAPIYMGLLSSYRFKPGEVWSIDLDDYFYDVDGDELTFSCNKPEVNIDAITHTAIWSPEKGEHTLKDVVFSANDGQVTVDSSPIDLEVNIEKSTPSFWEQFWWLFLLLTLVILLLLFLILKKRAEGEKEEIRYDINVEKAVDYLSTNGGNYIIKSETSDEAYNVFSGLLQSGFEGLCITTKPTETITQQYNLGKAWIIRLSLKSQKSSEGENEETKMMGLLAIGDEEREDDKYIFSSNFNRIVDTVEDFLTSGEKKVVLFDGLEYILVGDELIMYIGFIAALKERLKDRNSCLLIPIDPKTLSEKEMGLLERETLSLGKVLHESAKGEIKELGDLVSEEPEATADAAITEEEPPPPPPEETEDDKPD